MLAEFAGVLYMTTLTAQPGNQVLPRPAAGSSLVACMRKLLTTPNAMVKTLGQIASRRF